MGKNVLEVCVITTDMGGGGVCDLLCSRPPVGDQHILASLSGCLYVFYKAAQRCSHWTVHWLLSESVCLPLVHTDLLPVERATGETTGSQPRRTGENPGKFYTHTLPTHLCALKHTLWINSQEYKGRVITGCQREIYECMRVLISENWISKAQMFLDGRMKWGMLLPGSGVLPTLWPVNFTCRM